MNVNNESEKDKQFDDFKKMSRFEDEMNSYKILHNNYPIQDFLGLTPSEMHDLIYDPYGEDSGFQIMKVSDTTLDQIPFFLLAEHLILMIYRDKYTKLTSKGCLSLKYCKELLEKKLIKEDVFEGRFRKSTREDYFSSIKVVRIILMLSKQVLIRKNKMFLSKKALILLEERNRFELFKIIFKTYSNDFLWAYLDGHRSELIGQLGFAFSLTILKYYGSKSLPLSFYFDKYKKAFPLLENHLKDFQYFPKERQFISCYRLRLFQRFFEWFGLVKSEGKEDLLNPGSEIYRKTNILDDLFKTPVLLQNFL